MKFFLVIPSLAAGGAERVISLLANNWVKKEGVEVHLVLLANLKDFYSVDSRVVVHRLGFMVNQGAIARFFGIFRILFLLRRLIIQENPDFILSFMNRYNILTIISCFNKRKKVFVSERDSSNSDLPFSISVLRKITYRYAAGIIAQTDNYRDFIIREVGNPAVRVIPNPVRSVQLNPAICKEKIIINVGRLVSEKGQSYLLEAFAKLDSASTWTLVFLGDGPLLHSLKNRAIDLGVADRVRFMGAVKNVDEWLSRASIFAFSSVSEGFPNALAEAMVAGLPCVSFDCVAGPSDLIVDGENGFLIPVGDIHGLSSCIDILINNENLRNRISLEAKKVSAVLSDVKIAEEYFKFITK